jgi:hypothetical protein
MSYKILLYLVSLIVVVGACKTEEKKQEEPSQMEQVIAIHDEVMPKMGVMSKLVAQLKPKVDSTAAGQEYQKAMHDLQSAHKSMMDWMKGFGDRFTSDETLNGKELTPEKKEWLNEEEVKVKLLRDEINTSIRKAEELMEGN